LLKETTGAFDGSPTYDLHITSQPCNLLSLVTMADVVVIRGQC